MPLEDIVDSVGSVNVEQHEESLLFLLKKTKHKDDVAKLYELNLQAKLFDLLEEAEGRYQVAVLSILANCANVDDNWRGIFIDDEKLQKLKNILLEQTDASIISRGARLLANISKNSICLSLVQLDQQLLYALVKYGATITNEKCQSSCLRALRIICVTKETAKIVAENEHFPVLLTRLHSADPDLMLLCVRFVCELLKTQALEVGFRMIEDSVLHRLLELGRHTSEDVKELILEILFLLTLTAGCRVTVAMEGAIELFSERICNHDNTDSFKYATQGLCLCAREAVSRNKMKLCGVLQHMVKILQKDEYGMYHESLVAAFVWFLFDDSSLGLLIRADVTPSLLHFMDRLTHLDYKQAIDLDSTASSSKEFEIETPPRERRLLSAVFQPNTSYDVQCSPPHTQLICSSPETSPYNANSPQYSIPSFSPHMSPSYSPPSSPQSPLSLEFHGGYSDSLNESCGLSSKSVPYHFQSADGIHAMIHGTRGPIHDTLLLLSRFSQAKDPSSFFLYIQGFNAMLNYITLSKKPNPKCARILNRLTMNSHCFDLLLKKKLIPRLYLRLCTGWSLEHLTRLMEFARENKAVANDGSDTSESDEDYIDEDNLYMNNGISRECCRIGKLLLSNMQSQSETPYGGGVLSKILLTGSKDLQQICILSLPHIIWSARLRQKLLVDYKGFELLMKVLQESLDKDNETFVLAVEAVCALCRLLQLESAWCVTGEKSITCKLSNEREKEMNDGDDDGEPPRKRKRIEIKSITSTKEKMKINLQLPSGKTMLCNRESLRLNSEVFDRMLYSRYIEATKTNIKISDVDENAFIALIHYLHGCEIRLDKYCTCDVCTYPYGDKIETMLEQGGIRNPNGWRFAMDLLSCCERFFVDKLKSRCEIYLRDKISKENAGEIYLLSSWHHAEYLLKHCLIYILTKLDCPKLRSKYFVEILKSHEKEKFIFKIRSIILKKLKEER